jgi:Ca-activated chloride channel family protein
MSSTRRTFLSILAGSALIGGAILFFGVRDGGLPGLDSMPGLTAEPVAITVASSVTKQKWLAAAVEAFRASGAATADGRPIAITTSNVLSGESMLQIADRTLQPTVWSPGESAWVDQLDERWNRGNAKPVSSAPCQPTVLTPVGLAMWRPMAEALGWPGRPISLKTLIDLANDPAGWATLGHPEWGRLRLGHTHPQYSSAGLLFLASVIYATTGKTAGITADDIYAPEVEAALTTLAQNTAKYGMVTTDLLSNMARGGPAFLHVTSAFEEGAVRFNVERGAELRWPLAFVFPKEGTFWSDHPYCILDGAPWVTPEQAEAARLFLDFLRSDAMQARAGEFYIRPLDTARPLGSALSLANGTDPSASPATVPDLGIPSPEVSESIIDQFLTTKRKATVLVVFDVSGSMQGEFIKTATEATAAFLSRLDPRDRVGLLTFSTGIDLVAPIADVATTGETTRSRVLGLVAEGDTNLNGAVCRATRMIAEEQARDAAAGDNRLYGIVLLSDGMDTVGEISSTRMFQTCLTAREGREGPKLFVISFGEGTDMETLTRLANESNGALFTADPASIGQAYLRISAEQ